MPLTLVERPGQSARDNTPHIPGELGIWVFILGDMLMFSLFFIAYMVELRADVGLFNLSQQAVSVRLGTINTLLLLTSSYFVALAVSQIYKASDTAGRARLYFALAWLCGLAFVVNKYMEWADKVEHGFTLTTNHYFIYYYVLTGVHLLHVLIGLCVLSYLWIVAGRPPSERQFSTFETGATYWHMVDFLWLILFPLLYIIR